MNVICIIGRLTKDIELKYLKDGTAISKTSIAINEYYKDKYGNKQEDTTFIDIVFWSKYAEIANQYLNKGDKISITGSLKQDRWVVAQDGSKKSKHSIKVDKFEKLDSKNNKNNKNVDNFVNKTEDIYIPNEEIPF
jgi:single-strand DNA-binding protein